MPDTARNTLPIAVFKYGGNAMFDDALKLEVLTALCAVRAQGYRVVIAHGGGPFIQKALDQAGIKTDFVYGHRRTTPEVMRLVETTLKGEVNSELVGIINRLGHKAVGLSGKDGRTVTATRRYHREENATGVMSVDIGQVGEVSRVDTTLIELLLAEGYIPVMACIAQDEHGTDYNINADLFAGSLAGALKAPVFGVLTDVDGLMRDIDDPASLVPEIRLSEISHYQHRGIIKGGMLPKVDACRAAVEGGARCAMIINGTRPSEIPKLIAGNASTGTRFKV